MILRNLLSLGPQDQAVTTIPFSRLAVEEERKVVINKEDLRLAYLTNGLLNRAIKTRASLVISRGFQLTYENDRVKNCITKFLENVQKNDSMGLNLEMIMERMIRDADIFGNAFRLLVPNASGKAYVALKPLHPVNTDFRRTADGKIEYDESRNPVGYVVKTDIGEKLPVEKDEMVHLVFDVIGDELVGQSIITSVYNQLERLSNIEEGLAQAIFKKGWPLHEAILKNRTDWSPDETDIAYVDSQLNGIESASHFTHTDDYQLVIQDPKFPQGAMNYPIYFLDQVIAVTGVPKYILMGQENVSTRATADSLQRVMSYILRPLQEMLKVTIENQIFNRVLQKEGITGWCKIEWNDILPEQDDRIAEKINILASTLVEGKPILKHPEAREMLNLPEMEEVESQQQLSASPKTVAGIYLVEPHGELIAEGRKRAIVKSEKFMKHVGEPLALVSGNYIWGKIRMDSPVEINLDRFKELFAKHYISEEERKEWWPDKKLLYYYPIQILEVFKTPKFYKVPQGIQTFIAGLEV